MKEINVIGTMQLLAACQRAPSVKQLVVKSSTRVYGVSPKDPAMLTEDMEPNQLPRSGFPKDSVEVEGYVRGFARRRPDVAIGLLRIANILGPGMDTRLTRYFRSRWCRPCLVSMDACSSATRMTHSRRFSCVSSASTLAHSMWQVTA